MLLVSHSSAIGILICDGIGVMEIINFGIHSYFIDGNETKPLLNRQLPTPTPNIFSIFEKENSKKIGFYAPGTKIPIVSDRGLKKIRKNLPIINLAWHIKKEIKSYLKNYGIQNKLLSIIEKKDFRKYK